MKMVDFTRCEHFERKTSFVRGAGIFPHIRAIPLSCFYPKLFCAAGFAAEQEAGLQASI